MDGKFILGTMRTGVIVVNLDETYRNGGPEDTRECGERRLKN